MLQADGGNFHSAIDRRVARSTPLTATLQADIGNFQQRLSSPECSATAEQDVDYVKLNIAGSIHTYLLREA